jgi:hypothetical protein
MSIGLATRGVIAGFMGGFSGDVVYVDFPMCNEGPESEEIGVLSFTARDPNAISAIPNPIIGTTILPRRRSTVLILPAKNIYQAFPTPNE